MVQLWIQVATFTALAEFNCLMKFSPQSAVVSAIDAVQDAANGAWTAYVTWVDWR